MAIATGQFADIETSAYGEVMNRVAQQIIDLDLVEIKTRVYVLKTTFDRSLAESAGLPVCIVSMGVESATDAEGPLGLSTVHYPVIVSMIWGTDRSKLSNWGNQLLNRQRVARSFRKKRPTWAAMTQATLKKTTVKAGEPFVNEATRQALDAQWLLIDAQVTEVRE